ncbi:hypothetical protein B0H11DRAFT_2366060 [Mycena galericulata]|nr:hypothetical protein B0H11DRAFT_2366060 [Mycena galericulata]
MPEDLQIFDDDDLHQTLKDELGLIRMVTKLNTVQGKGKGISGQNSKIPVLRIIGPGVFSGVLLLAVPQMVTGFVIMAHHTFMVFNPREWVNAKVDVALVVIEIVASLYSGRVPLETSGADLILARGEARAIVAARILILFGLCFTIPAFGIYVAVYVPYAAQVMIQDIKVSQGWVYGDLQDVNYDLAEQNITIVLTTQRYMPTNLTSTENATVGVQGCANVTIPTFLYYLPNVTCPFSWDSAPPGGIVVAANFSDPWGALYVKPGQGDPTDVDIYTEPIPLMAGTRLSVVLSYTARQIFSNNALDLLGFQTPLRTVSVNSVLLIQADTSTSNSTDTVTLRLRPRQDIPTWIPTRVVKDFTDASVLSGLATLGGFWTFTNGAFAMLFGANIIYFLSRSRPLSALGVVHIFQRRALMRNWNADLPALRTEGGRPGSEEAGIVAFIRERLVSVDDPEPTPIDAEGATHSAASDLITIVEGGNVSESEVGDPSENEQLARRLSGSNLSGPLTSNTRTATPSAIEEADPSHPDCIPLLPVNQGAENPRCSEEFTTWIELNLVDGIVRSVLRNSPPKTNEA